MTDERYAYVEDVKNRKNVAKSGGKRGKSRYGCTLPVDYMTTKEKRDSNSRWISITYDRPISFDKFLAYSDDDKKIYLQTLIDKYGGTTEQIAKMFGCTEAKVKKFRQDLEVKRSNYDFLNKDSNISIALWETFLTNDSFLRKPMSFDDFKALDYYDQTHYIGFLVETMGLTVRRISMDLFEKSDCTLGEYLKYNKIPYYNRSKGYRIPAEKLEAFKNWLGKPEEIKEEPIPETAINPDDEIEIVEEHEQDPIEMIAPVGPVGTEEYEIEYMNTTMTIYSMDQIPDILAKLPKSHHGSITFNY